MAVHLCPVCNGKGLVSADFYNVGSVSSIANKAPITCHTCKGDGVLWDKVFGISSNPNDSNLVRSIKNPKRSSSNCEVILNDGFLGKVGP